MLLRLLLTAVMALFATQAFAQQPETMVMGLGTCQLTAKPRSEKPRCFEWSVGSSCPESNFVVAFYRDVCDGKSCDRSTRLSPIRDKEIFVCGPKDGPFFVPKNAAKPSPAKK